MRLYRSSIGYYLLLVMGLSLAAGACRENAGSQAKTIDTAAYDISQKNSELIIGMDSLLSHRDPRQAELVKVDYDPYFKSPKSFRGFSITPLLDSIIKSNRFDTTRAILVFYCNDGYSPVMDIARIYDKTKGYFAIEDMDPHQKDSSLATFKPYYLVWDHVNKGADGYAWPYGLLRFKLISVNSEYKSIYPYKDLSLAAGFDQFRDHCMKCHSVNKIGGSVGPDFNYPKNILDYWRENDVIAFARNPAGYRYNSRMPPVTNISDSGLRSIVLYLRSLAKN